MPLAFFAAPEPSIRAASRRIRRDFVGRPPLRTPRLCCDPPHRLCGAPVYNSPPIRNSHHLIHRPLQRRGRREPGCARGTPNAPRRPPNATPRPPRAQSRRPGARVTSRCRRRSPPRASARGPGPRGGARRPKRCRRSCAPVLCVIAPGPGSRAAISHGHRSHTARGDPMDCNDPLGRNDPSGPSGVSRGRPARTLEAQCRCESVGSWLGWASNRSQQPKNTWEVWICYPKRARRTPTLIRGRPNSPASDRIGPFWGLTFGPTSHHL